MVTKAEIDGDMGDTHVGLLARLMSQAMRKLTAVISKTNCVAIFINQVREKIGVVYGNPEVTTGGRALKFYSSVRIEVRKGESIKVGGEIVGARTKCKVVKNKVAPPFKDCEFDLMFGKGISRVGEIVDLAVELDIIKKSGAWFSYGEGKIGQGRDNAKEYLLANPDIMDKVESEIKEALDKAAKKNIEDAKSQLPKPGELNDDIDILAEADKVSKSAKKKSEEEADDNFDEFTPVDNK